MNHVVNDDQVGGLACLQAADPVVDAQQLGGVQGCHADGVAQAVAGVGHQIADAVVQGHAAACQLALIVVVQVGTVPDAQLFVVLVVGAAGHGVGNQADLFITLGADDHLDQIGRYVNADLVADHFGIHLRIVQAVFIAACTGGALRTAFGAACVGDVGADLDAVMGKCGDLVKSCPGVAMGEDGVGGMFLGISHEFFNVFPVGIDGPDANHVANAFNELGVFLGLDGATPLQFILEAAGEVHKGTFHVQAVHDLACAGLGGFADLFCAFQHGIHVQIVVEGGQNGGLAVLQEIFRAIGGVLSEQPVTAAVIVNVDETGCGVQTLCIIDLCAFRNGHVLGPAYLHDFIAFISQCAIPDDAVFHDQFGVDDCFHWSSPFEVEWLQRGKRQRAAALHGAMERGGASGLN